MSDDSINSPLFSESEEMVSYYESSDGRSPVESVETPPRTYTIPLKSLSDEIELPRIKSGGKIKLISKTERKERPYFIYPGYSDIFLKSIKHKREKHKPVVKSKILLSEEEQCNIMYPLFQPPIGINKVL
jgi:hypothetical protein